MTRILSILVLSAWLHFAAGAQNYFNVKSTLHSNALIMSGVLERNDKYYTSSTCLDSANYIGNGYFYSVIGVRFSVWSKTGQLLYDSVYQRADSGVSNAANKRIIELPNHTFLIAGNGADRKGHVKLFLFCFDSTAHLIWTKEWDKPVEFPVVTPEDDWLLADFKPDGHGNYLMLSSIARGPNNQTLLMKLDSGFNETWHKDFGDNKYNSIAQSLIIENDGYTFGGYYSSINQTTKDAFYRAELFKTDTAGNLTWHWLSDSSRLTLGTVGLIKTKDGGYIFSGQGAGDKIVYQFSAVVHWWPWIEKIDAAGKSLWHTIVNNHHTTDADYCSINELVELPNGDIMAAGQIGYGYGAKDTLSGNFGALLKLTPNGQIKWKRKYSYHGDTMTYHVYDMKPTSDGGYIMAGQTFDEYHRIPSTIPWQRAWLLKVDSNGCTSNDDPQCWAVGVPHEPKLAAGSYKVYPNPATEQLQISYQKEDEQEEAFMLSDITGRVVAQSPLNGKAGIRTVALRALQSGMYLYRIINGKTVKQSGRISKQ